MSVYSDIARARTWKISTKEGESSVISPLKVSVYLTEFAPITVVFDVRGVLLFQIPWYLHNAAEDADLHIREFILWLAKYQQWASHPKYVCLPTNDLWHAYRQTRGTAVTETTWQYYTSSVLKLVSSQNISNKLKAGAFSTIQISNDTAL